jgi:L-2-hydroxyglutarate oxidase
MNVDFLVVGGGIVGLALARELKKRSPKARILVLEKEAGLGFHASGRNSGVLHSGIFYAEDSTKAKVCSAGGKEMAEFCLERKLPIEKTGKVILPTSPHDEEILMRLYERGKKNGIHVFLVDSNALKKIEPHAYSATGKALHLPEVCIVEPLPILNEMAKELQEQGVEIRLNTEVQEIYPQKKIVVAGGEKVNFGHLFNSAGLYAEKVAHAFGIGMEYTILPFKGLYFKIAPEANLKINGLIYAVPNPNLPFLGIHFMKKINGEILAGPTVVPAFGRENYHGFEKLKAGEAFNIFKRLLQLYCANKKGFRNLVHQEGPRFLKPFFFTSARKLVPDLKMQNLLKSSKVGIRAQLVNIKTMELVLDFLVETESASTHILNAVSPAFTSSFAFAKLVLDKAGF